MEIILIHLPHNVEAAGFIITDARLNKKKSAIRRERMALLMLAQHFITTRSVW